MFKNFDPTAVLVIFMMVVFLITFGFVFAYDTYKNSELEKFAIENRCELIIVPNTNSTYWGNCKK